MKKYHIYGLGNALVDYDFHIDDEVLAKLNIDKGLMTLIDEQRHHEILSVLNSHPFERCCGGSAANTLIISSQLGGKNFYSAKVANDESGDFYLADLLHHGVDSCIAKDNRDAGVTGKCIVMTTPDTHRTLTTHLGITQHLSQAELDISALKASQYLYIEGHLAEQHEAWQAALSAKQIAEQHGILTSLNLSDPNITNHRSDKLHTMLDQAVDLLFCNIEEAYSFTGCTDLASTCSALKHFAKSFAITRGAEGSIIYDGQEYHEIPAITVNAIDSVGAGDIYAGAILHGICHGFTLKAAAELASVLAAEVVCRVGPRLPKAKALALLTEFMAKNTESESH